MLDGWKEALWIDVIMDVDVDGCYVSMRPGR